MRLYYSQNKEDLLIKGFFPDIKKGFYIDVGANDPVIDSVTKLLYDEGWSGINIEPIPKHYKQLLKQRARDVNLQIGLSDESGTLSFRQYTKGDGLSTFDKSMIKLYESDTTSDHTAKYVDSEVPVKTLESVIKDVSPKHIHFIKIDVEGYEYEVLKGYNWQSKRPELVCIEASHIVKDWRPILENNDFSLAFFDGVNNYYLAKESLYRKKYFDYPSQVFAGNPVYYPAFLEIKTSTEEDVSKRTEGQIDRLTNLIVDRDHEILTLQNQQRNVRFLAKRLQEEIHTRLKRRANPNLVKRRLEYRKDKVLSDYINSNHADLKNLLSAIHERDQLNVRLRTTARSSYFKRLFWRLSSKFFDMCTPLLKKLASRT